MTEYPLHSEEKRPFSPRKATQASGRVGAFVFQVISIEDISMKIGGEKNAKDVKSRQGRTSLLS